MSERVAPRMAMIVMNDITSDSRVKKAAASAARLGFDVHVYGTTNQAATWSTSMGPVQLIRVPPTPPARDAAPFLGRQDGRFVFSPLAPVAFSDHDQLEFASERRRQRALRRTTATGASTRRVAAATSAAVDRVDELIFRVRRKGLLGTPWAAWSRTRHHLGRSSTTIESFLAERLPGLLPSVDALATALAAFDPQIIHAHDITALPVAALHHERTQNPPPFIYDAHEWVAGIHSSNSTRTAGLVELERRWGPTAAGIVTVSDPLATIIQKGLELPSAPRVVLNAPPSVPAVSQSSDARSTIRGALALGAEVPLIVYPGVVKPQRGLETVIQAMSGLADVHLALITDPHNPHLEAVREQARSLECAERLHVHPYVSPGEVAHFMSDATIGVHPLHHYPNAEIALPTKLFEYLHAGLPCVVSDVAEMKRFVETHGVGEVFIGEDPDSLRATLQQVLGNRDRYVAAITDELTERCSWEKQETVLSEAYAEVLDLPISPPCIGLPLDLAETTLP